MGIPRYSIALMTAIGMFQSQVAILGWGYPRSRCHRRRLVGGFNRRWRFLGGDTPAGLLDTMARLQVSIAGGDSWVGIHDSDAVWKLELLKFQSQVAILGWGYTHPTERNSRRPRVSIAGGDSWVGIHGVRRVGANPPGFNRRWRFLGGDTLMGS